MAADTGTPAAVPEVCAACRFGHGPDRACVLLESGNQEALLSEGPCRIPDRIRAETGRLVRRRYPFARRLEDDLASDVVLHLIECGRLLVPGTIRHLPVLDRRVHEMVRSATIDALRHHKLVTRIRCGACEHFAATTPPPGCHLPFLPELGEDARPNPHFGSQVERTTDPRELDPRCDAFSWRRPETHDLFSEKVPGLDPGGTPRERAVALVVGALDKLLGSGDAGMRAASVVFRHYLRGVPVHALASEAGVSDKTIKRLLAEGRERLLGILEKEFGVANPEEVLA